MEPREVWGRATGSDDFSLLFNLSGTKLYVLRMEDPLVAFDEMGGIMETPRRSFQERLECAGPLPEK
jgi:hypothetical protein